MSDMLHVYIVLQLITYVVAAQIVQVVCRLLITIAELIPPGYFSPVIRALLVIAGDLSALVDDLCRRARNIKGL